MENNGKGKENNSEEKVKKSNMKYNFSNGYSLNKDYIGGLDDNENALKDELFEDDGLENDITKQQMVKDVSCDNNMDNEEESDNNNKRSNKNVNMGNYTYTYLDGDNISDEFSDYKMQDTKRYNMSDFKDMGYSMQNTNVFNTDILDDEEYMVSSNYKNNKKNKKFNFFSDLNDSKKWAIICTIIIVLVIIIIIPLVIYRNNLKPVDKENAKEVLVDIEEGSSGKKISKTLKEAGVIRSEFSFNTYAKKRFPEFKAGKYMISTGDSAEDIITKLVEGDVYHNIVKIQLREGQTATDLAKVIADATNNKIGEEEVLAKMKDTNYLNTLIAKYWFLTDDILDSSIYYPLEGYLFPDTYNFDIEEVTVEDIFESMLNETEEKLKQYNEFKGKKALDIHECVTLASVVEKETNDNADERETVATIFMNRLKKGMNLGSDVTTYYANMVDMGERDLTRAEIAKQNPYNTRASGMGGKLPVGPICMPSESSLIAAIDVATAYKPTSALFFVADKNGNIYTSSTNAEHEAIIAKLKQQGLWYEYD